MPRSRLLRYSLLLVIAILAAGGIYTSKETARAAAEYPPTGSFIAMDGVQLHYQLSGSGQPVVLIHGNPGSLHDYDAVVPGLEADHRVLVIDRPGHGHSERPSAATPIDQARLLHALIQKLGLSRPVLVGHSWGGALALIYALEYPDDVSGLVVVGARANVRPDGERFLYRVVRTPVLGAALERTVLLPIGWRAVGNGLTRAYRPDPVPPEELARAQAMWLRPIEADSTVWDTANVQEALAAYVPRFGLIQAQTTIVVGMQDDLLGEDTVLHQQLPHSTLMVLPNTGHMVPKTRPEAIVQAVRQVRVR